MFSRFSPECFQSPLSESLLKKALDKGILKIRIRNLRDFTEDKHRMTDDYPYGGGAGMVMKPEPVIRAVEEIKAQDPEARSVLLTPQGEPFHQKVAREMSAHPHWILICGRYEGLDERVRLTAVDREISIGDYVLTGGEIPALVLIDAVSRYIPGVLGCAESVEEDSFAGGFWNILNIRDRPFFGRWRFPRFSFREIMPRLNAGGGGSLCEGLGAPARSPRSGAVIRGRPSLFGGIKRPREIDHRRAARRTQRKNEQS